MKTWVKYSEGKKSILIPNCKVSNCTVKKWYYKIQFDESKDEDKLNIYSYLSGDYHFYYVLTSKEVKSSFILK